MIPDWSEAFSNAWATCGYEGSPIGHDQINLRTNTWVRFHCFPNKQYPANLADDAQVFDRFAAIGNAIFSQGEEIYYISLWVPEAEGPDGEPVYSWSARTTAWQAIEWKQTLLSTAYDHAMSFGLFSPQSGWFLSPYDGGFDVFSKDSVKRDALKNQFPGWLPKHPIRG